MCYDSRVWIPNLHHRRQIGAKDDVCALGNCISKAGAKRISLKRLASPKVQSVSGSNARLPMVLPLCAAVLLPVPSPASHPSNARSCPSSWAVGRKPTACAAKSGLAPELASSSSEPLGSAIIRPISLGCSKPFASACNAQSDERASARQQLSRPGATHKPLRSKNAQAEQRTLVFLDEAGFYLLPMAVRTYAPVR